MPVKLLRFQGFRVIRYSLAWQSEMTQEQALTKMRCSPPSSPLNHKIHTGDTGKDTIRGGPASC